MSSPVRVLAPSHTFRPEIQGVRAIAVVAVLVFHLWPSLLPGGYIGVDVFFVVSGFLITGLLLRQFERHGHISLLDFYGKRIKRLVPAATLVLFAVGFCISVLPVLRWSDTAAEIAASALYFENWWLAAKSVDYLASDAPPSPLQHYWSLSVEEQYYIVWPLMLAALAAVGVGRRFSPRQLFGAAVVVVGFVSFAYSVYITPRNPGLSYFATTTRAWELALGGALAVFTRWEQMPAAFRQTIGVIGLLMISVCLFTFGSETAFPGYAAAIPTLGAAFLIISGRTDSKLSLFSVLGSRPAQYVGDLSYSLYLWHWPVIVFYREIAGRDVGLVDGFIIAGVSLALAHQTKELVEDRFRAPSFLAPERWKPFALAAACVTVPLICWAAINFQVNRYAESAPISVEITSFSHPGALSRTHGIAVPSDAPFLPTIAAAPSDRGDPYHDRCVATTTEDIVKECVYGDSKAERHIVIVGDSHAVQWIPALQVLTRSGDVRLTGITKSACAVAALPLAGVEREQYRSCLTWARGAIERLIQHQPDAVIFAHSHNSLSKIGDSREESANIIATNLRETWRRLDALGIKVYALVDTPSFPRRVPDCLASSRGDAGACVRARSQALPQVDPLVIAASLAPEVTLLDYTDVFCDSAVCYPVVGNVLAWRDAHHMTRTFAETFAPALSRDLQPFVSEVHPELVTAGTIATSSPDSSELVSGLSCDSAESCQGFLRPSLANVSDDVPAAYAQGCHVAQRAEEPIGCLMGDRNAEVRLFVVGDSHAAQWLPAYDVAAREHGFGIESFTKSACSFSDLMVIGGVSRGEYRACRIWGDNLIDKIREERPDYVLLSQSVTYTVSGYEKNESFGPLVDGYTRRLETIKSFGSTPIVLADTPRLGINVPECLARSGATFADCTRPSGPLLARPDPLVEAAERVGVEVMSLNDLICRGDFCSPVSNGIIVWRDSHHVTATFAAASGKAFGTRLKAVMRE